MTRRFYIGNLFSPKNAHTQDQDPGWRPRRAHCAISDPGTERVQGTPCTRRNVRGGVGGFSWLADPRESHRARANWCWSTCLPRDSTCFFPKKYCFFGRLVDAPPFRVARREEALKSASLFPVHCIGGRLRRSGWDAPTSSAPRTPPGIEACLLLGLSLSKWVCFPLHICRPLSVHYE